MAKTRVHELAKEFGITSQEVLAVFKESGEFVKSASSTVELPAEMKFRNLMLSRKSAISPPDPDPPSSGSLASDEALQALREKLTGGPPRTLLPTYHADDAMGPDLLAVEAKAISLARLIASKHIAPPLSLGVFGDWGSGKSFLMHRIGANVEELSALSRSVNPSIHKDFYWKHIAQVRFNAWHYSDDNLWAALVTEILGNLRTDPAEPQDLLVRRQREILDMLEEQRTVSVAAQFQLREAEVRVERAREELDNVSKQQRALEQEVREVSGQENAIELRALSPDAVRAGKQALESAGFAVEAETLEQLDGALVEAQETLESGRNAWLALAGAKDRGRRFAWLIIAIMSIPTVILFFAISNWGLINSTVSAVLALSAGLAAGAAWVKMQLEWARSCFNAVVTARGKLKSEAAARRDKLSAERADIEARITALQNEVVEARNREEREQAELDRVTRELSPMGIISKLVDDRAAGGDYSSRRGMLASVRADFELISRCIDAANQADVHNPNAYSINRIVLYVDDLDRCSPDVVVGVLQAVHLLLSLPLFVVVVGVDPAWVTSALKEKYPLAFSDGALSSEVYLEKIFQIPIWTTPLDPQRASAMMAGLLPDDVSLYNDKTPSRQRETDTPPTIGRAELANTSYASFSPSERTALEDASELVTVSPRGLKRFSNTYRVIKSMESIGERHSSADTRAVILLLAMATGMPGLMDSVRFWVASNPSKHLPDLMNVLPPGRETSQFREWLARNPSWGEVSAKALARQLLIVDQFSFHGFAETRAPLPK